MTVNLADATAFGEILLATISLVLNLTFCHHEVRPTDRHVIDKTDRPICCVMKGQRLGASIQDCLIRRAIVRMTVDLKAYLCGLMTSHHLAPENIIHDDGYNIQDRVFFSHH